MICSHDDAETLMPGLLCEAIQPLLHTDGRLSGLDCAYCKWIKLATEGTPLLLSASSM
jgi:hypothetical protein